MNKNILIILILIVTTAILSATTWRVDNNTGVDADFTNLQDAHNGVSSGDILVVTGSTTSYGNITLTKTLTIIGTGYFLTENTDTQANQHPSQAGYFIFNAGSESSMITGISITYIDINVDDITIKKNKIYSTGSPAIGAGATGEDCGAYDGLYPYVLSGMPSEIPSIYYFFSPGAGFEIPVEIKAKSHE